MLFCRKKFPVNVVICTPQKLDIVAAVSSLSFDKMFCKNQDIHYYFTRQYYKLHVTKFKIIAYKHSVKYMGVLLWNRICDKIDNKCSFFTFKFRLKEYLLYNEIVI